MMTTMRLLSLVALFGIATSHQRHICEIDGFCGRDECGVYIAPSTIPNAGLGIFTANDVEEGGTVGVGDLAIPIVDIAWHVGGGEYFWLFEEYVWQGWSMGMQQETEDQDKEAVTAFCPGLDALVNCNAALLNTGKSMPQCDSAGLHRFRDPGAGAITYYQNGTSFTTAAIPAGGELFKYYGDNWFFTRTPEFGLIPYESHYRYAERILKKFAGLDLSEKIMEALWTIVDLMPWESRIANALPKTSREALLGAEKGIGAIYQPAAIRSIEFLEENGRCIDNIRPAQSTINGAGRGAFATRFLEEGSIITGSPLLHVPFRHLLTMYGYYFDDKSQLIRNTTDIIGYQLLLNYCYGHAESTLLLCPYGGGIGYINHNKSLANVKIQWAPDGYVSQNNSWFDMDVSEMEWKYRVSLGMDYVATRDILPGEELFLDYGDEWEEAWQAYVQHWKPREDEKDYIPAVEMNKKMKGKMLRTKLEQKIEPYPDNLEIRCHSRFDDEMMRDLDEWEELERGVGCDILYRGVENDVFTYEVVFHDIRDDKGKPLRRTYVPRAVLKFMDVPYTTDLHLSNVFRHEIMIPDEIFPEKWKNSRKPE